MKRAATPGVAGSVWKSLATHAFDVRAQVAAASVVSAFAWAT